MEDQNRLKVYLAGPIFNDQQRNIMEALDDLLVLRCNAEVFNPYRASRPIWNGRAPKDCTAAERLEVLTGNIDHLAWCDVLVAWLGGTVDGKTDTGVVWEMGYAQALRRNGRAELNFAGVHIPATIGYVHPYDERQRVNLMLAGTMDAVVRDHHQLEQVINMVKNGQGREIGRYYPADRALDQEADPIR